jgi:hypothetical protein
LRKRLLAILSILTLMFVVGTTAATATTTTEYFPGNPACDGTKIDPVAAGTYDLQGGGHVTITLTGNNTFSFNTGGSATVSSVMVKGGPNALLWTFTPSVTSATGLHAPLNPNNGKWYGLSHLCFESAKKGGPPPKK